jgi:hypothetical protein
VQTDDRADIGDEEDEDMQEDSYQNALVESDDCNDRSESESGSRSSGSGSGSDSDGINEHDEEKRYCSKCDCDHHEASTFVQETDMWKFELKHMTAYKHACFKCVGCSNPLVDGVQVWMCKLAWNRDHPCDIAYCVGCFFKCAWNRGRPLRGK